MATTHCLRCKGTGYRDTPVVHLGMPGRCYGCDGDGTRATQLRKQAEVRAAKALAAKQQLVHDKIDKVREVHGLNLLLPRDKRRAFPMYEVFTTADWAAKFGMELRDAWVELCRSTKFYPAFDAEGNGVGWMIG